MIVLNDDWKWNAILKNILVYWYFVGVFDVVKIMQRAKNIRGGAQPPPQVNMKF
jgi:hypothetical protein